VGRKRKNIDYRQLYKDYYGIDFGDDMAIHHIDFDRTNNNIDNLLMLPKKLHAKYHWNVSALGGSGTGIINGDVRLMGSTRCLVPKLRGLADALEEIGDWERTKYQMDMMKFSGVRWDEVVRF
jgi:hypothetical protein